MRFEFEQLVGAPVDVVERAYGDPDFYLALGDTPGIGVTGVLDRTEDAGTVTMRVRFAFTGRVAPAVRAVVDPSHLTWVTVLTQEAGSHGVVFDIVPDHHRDLLVCHGEYRFEAGPAGGTTRQRVSGDLSVRVPLMGRTAERAIVSGFEEHLAAEATILSSWPPPG